MPQIQYDRTYKLSVIKKMQDYIVSNNAALSLREIKERSTIEIKGIGKNGKERNIPEEMYNKYGKAFLEDYDNGDASLPPFPEGVIRTKISSGYFYIHFKIVNQTDDEFDLELYEYLLQDNVFRLNVVVGIKGISKTKQLFGSNFYFRDVRTYFIEEYEKHTLKEFNKTEIDIIKEEKENTIPDNISSDYAYELAFSTLSIFRSVNFIKNTNAKDFFDNEYFSIKNFDEDFQNTAEESDEEYFNSIIESKNTINIVKNHCLEKMISQIIYKNKINSFYSAVGFVFKSGLKKLSPVIDIITESKGNCEIIIGSLQNCNREKGNNKIDRQTVIFLNQLINDKKINIFTYEKAFYHGKFYYLCNDEKAYIIIGSSNISYTAFKENYEMDIIHIVDKGSTEDQQYLDWYKALKSDCIKVDLLDENKFSNIEWASEIDAYNKTQLPTISRNRFKDKIAKIKDEDTRLRLEAWEKNNPTNIYENNYVVALKDYTILEYAHKKIAVFETFEKGQAYYVFKYENDIEELLVNLATRTKTDMRLNSSEFIDRGYHISQGKREERINNYFID